MLDKTNISKKVKRMMMMKRLDVLELRSERVIKKESIHQQRNPINEDSDPFHQSLTKS